MGEPSPFDPAFPRYAPSTPFPPYRHVPGETPHPHTDPLGHSYGTSSNRDARRLDLKTWRQNDTYLYGVDLYNYAYWWEAHEQWEVLWALEKRNGACGFFLRGLIQVSAAFIKWWQDNDRGLSNLFERAHSNLAQVPVNEPYMGVGVSDFIETLNSFFRAYPRGSNALGPSADPATMPMLRLHNPAGSSATG